MSGQTGSTIETSAGTSDNTAPLLARWPDRLLDVLAWINGLLGAGLLIMLYGFYQLPWPQEALSLGGLVLDPEQFYLAVGIAVAGIFALERLARLWAARDRRAFMRVNWMDYALLLAGAAGAAWPGRLTQVLSAAALYVVLTQAYILAAFVLRGAGRRLRGGACASGAAILLSALVVLAAAGAGLLKLPVARPVSAPHLWLTDASLISASAVSGTGLTTRNLGSDFTGFGQAIILALVQIGGLVTLTLGTIVVLQIGRGLAGRHGNTLGSMLRSERYADGGKVALFVAVLTLAVEAMGTALAYPMFLGALSADGYALAPTGALWHSAFHSVCAFCNVGFSLYGDGLSGLRDRPQVLGVIAPLIVLGSLGVPLLHDACAWVLRPLRLLAGRGRWQPLAPNTRWGLGAAAVLIVLGAALLVYTENAAMNKNLVERAKIQDAGNQAQADWQGMSDDQRMRQGLFQSVSARSGGVCTMDLGQLSDAGKLALCWLMAIGGGISSAGGGTKTVVLLIVLGLAISGLRRDASEPTHPRSLAGELGPKALAMFLAHMLLLGAVVLLLCVTEKSQGKFTDLLFEASSACGNVGLSTGLTAGLTDGGKFDLTAAMLLGRIGPLILLMVLTRDLRGRGAKES